MVMFSTGVIRAIVVEAVENKLYYTDSSKNTVNVIVLKTGKMRKILQNLTSPVGLAVDRAAG